MARRIPSLTRLVPFFLLLAIGIILAFFLMGREWYQMRWEIPGTPNEYPLAQWLRPWLISIGCFLPAVGALIYAFSNIMDRYITRLFLGTFLLCTGILSVIFILGDFAENADDFSNFSNPLAGILRFYAMQMPMVLNLILPYTLLLGSLWTLSKLSASSELTGMLQSGRSLLRIVTPILIGSCFIAVYSGIFSFHWAPNASLYRKLLFASLDENNKTDVNPYGQAVRYKNDSDKRIWNIRIPPNIDEPGAPLQDVHIEFFSSPGNVDYEIFADYATWNPNTRVWTFYNAIKRIHPEASENLAHVPQYEDKREQTITASFKETPWQLISSSLRSDTQGTPEIVGQLANSSLNHQLRLSLRTETHVRLARAFSCIILAFIAIPSAITFQRRSVMAGIGIAIFLAALMMFLFEFFPTLATAGHIPPWLGAWLPNILYCGVAVYLFNSKLAMRGPLEWFKAQKTDKQLLANARK